MNGPRRKTGTELVPADPNTLGNTRKRACLGAQSQPQQRRGKNRSRWRGHNAISRRSRRNEHWRNRATRLQRYRRGRNRTQRVTGGGSSHCTAPFARDRRKTKQPETNCDCRTFTVGATQTPPTLLPPHSRFRINLRRRTRMFMPVQCGNSLAAKWTADNEGGLFSWRSENATQRRRVRADKSSPI